MPLSIVTCNRGLGCVCVARTECGPEDARLEAIYEKLEKIDPATFQKRAGELLFLAGLGPRDPATNTVPGGPIEDADGARLDYDAAAQTRSCIANVREVLAAHDLTLDDVVDVTCYLVDMRRDFEAFNSEYAAAFGVLDAPPTRTTMEVAQLPPGGRIAVELKVVARCDKGA